MNTHTHEHTQTKKHIQHYRWDTDWYVKRRHAVLVVLTTYYLVYNVIFIAPVLLLVMPPHTLRRPLWVFRMCGVDYMLLQLWYQV